MSKKERSSIDEEIISHFLFNVCHIDYPLFKKQKNSLVKMLLAPEKYNLTNKELDHIQGIVNILDNFTDLFEDYPEIISKILFEHLL